MRDLRYRPNKVFKLIAKILFPDVKDRSRLMSYIERFNQFPEKRDKLSPEFARYINDKYFLNDIRELEILIQRNLDVWLNEK